MIIGYARVSTKDQEVYLQIDALKKAGCEKIFAEKASGAQRDRPQLMAALDYAREGDTIIVWKFDRLARSLKQLLETIEMLEARKVNFTSLTENIDTSTPIGRLTFHICSSLAEFERSLIKERIIAGLEAARANGKIGGRPRSMTPDDIAVAKTLLKDGYLTVGQVAERLSVSYSTLYRYIPSARNFEDNEV